MSKHSPHQNPAITPERDIAAYVADRARRVREASIQLAATPTEVKNAALTAMAAALLEHADELTRANRKDLEAGRAKGLDAAMLDRLALTPARIQAMATGLNEVAALPDPVGEIENMQRRPGGFLVGRMRVPIGVIGIVYESRPNVTADAAALCIKSGNGVILKGGSEAIHSNTAIARVLDQAGAAAGLPRDCVMLLETTDRAAVDHLLVQTRYIDLIIPRGGEGLIRMVTDNSRIPVVKHDKGLCHTYVDKAADLDMALRLAENAKVQRPGTCNALETLLVHRDLAADFLPRLGTRMQKLGVKLHACPRALPLLKDSAPTTVGAVDPDWDTEWLCLEMSVKVVDSYADAVAHIRRHGSQHTEVIVTADYTTAMRFVREVDAAAVQVNASSRLHDGSVFGLGAEIGISTSRLHARGAMGLRELTCQKFVVLGDGQLRT
ncbi:MAG: glutamate-5-semialdehyde dehydrogenase [Nitrospirota bacterium]|nr:glutamate-5-semialdehyde dehydrogenase [Nitrospirota bacterium]